MKLIMAARQWVMRKNLPTALAISISSTSPFANGLNANLSTSNVWIHRSILQITSPKHTPAHFFTDMLTTYLDIPPRYSPAYETIVNTFVQTSANDPDNNIVQYVPTLFTTPSTATANRTSMPSHEDVKDNPWLPIILWNEDYNSMFTC